MRGAVVKRVMIIVLRRLGLLPVALTSKRLVQRTTGHLRRRIRLARFRLQANAPPGSEVLFVADWPATGVRTDDLDVVEERHRNLETVRCIMSDAGLAHFVSHAVTNGRTRVGVFGAADQVLHALEQSYGDFAVSVERGGKIVRARDRVAASSLKSRVQESDLLVVHRPVLFGSQMTPIDGSGVGCEIEIWERHEELSQVFVTACVNPVSREMRLTEEPEGLVEIAEFAWLGDAWRPPFEIDLVYTWVDGADPAWRERRQRYEPRAAASDGTGDERFESFDELRYSLRSVREHAPFFRHIYLVTDQQRPTWLRDDAGIHVIDHAEIFSDPSVLPVFNSHAIESQLHHISGLSEHYVYMNDDVFFGRNCGWTNLFTVGGISRFAESRARIPVHPAADAPSVDHSGSNTRQLLHQLVGYAPSRKMQHTPHSQLRSIHEELEARIPDVYQRVARHRFRSVHDISLAALLHHRYAEATGRALPSRYNYDYLNLARTDLEASLQTLQLRRPMMFCLNDGLLPSDRRREVTELLRRTLEAMFPVPAPWEFTPPSGETHR